MGPFFYKKTDEMKSPLGTTLGGLPMTAMLIDCIFHQGKKLPTQVILIEILRMRVRIYSPSFKGRRIFDNVCKRLVPRSYITRGQ